MKDISHVFWVLQEKTIAATLHLQPNYNPI